MLFPQILEGFEKDYQKGLKHYLCKYSLIPALVGSSLTGLVLGFFSQETHLTHTGFYLSTSDLQAVAACFGVSAVVGPVGHLRERWMKMWEIPKSFSESKSVPQQTSPKE